MKFFLEFLFRCQHRRTTFPITPGRHKAAKTGTYIVCLDCGREFPYNWQEMRVETPGTSPTVAGAIQKPAHSLSSANR